MIELKQRIETYISEALSGLGAQGTFFVVERPSESAHGDFATNAAMVAAKNLGRSPRSIAAEISSSIEAKHDVDIKKVDIAGPGFINITLSDDCIEREFSLVLDAGYRWGRTEYLKGKHVMVEYTDPNPFKEFHIGHLMPNTIGESIARLAEFSGAYVRRVNYQGDVGMHVAKAVWGIEHSHENMPSEESDFRAKANFLGKAYAKGAKAFEEDLSAKEAITKINKQIYEGSDPLVNALYMNGKRWSLEYFEIMYSMLGTKFDHYFFESQTAIPGKEIVEKYIGDVFEKSDGAVVFPGEKYGFHTRVFINSEGLPTYEAKELGLAKTKYDLFPYDLSIIVTANEIKEYFKVLLCAMAEVYKDDGLAQKTTHIAHGVLKLPSGKLSSREGNVITALSLIDEAKGAIRAKISDDRGFDESKKDEIAQAAAVGAIKYSILRQEVGKDIIYDFEQSISLEGDSGPYLEYSLARIKALERRAEQSKDAQKIDAKEERGILERYMLRFPEVVLRAQKEYAPHHVASFAIELAHLFNSYYAEHAVFSTDGVSVHRLGVMKAVGKTLEQSLYLLGIPVLEEM